MTERPLPPVEKPIAWSDTVGNPEMEQARRDQLDRYIRGEIVFPGQGYDSREVLEAALKVPRGRG